MFAKKDSVIANDKIVLSVEQVLELFLNGIIGTLEFRNWLARRSPEFATVRDHELDFHIEKLAETQRRLMYGDEDQASDIPTS